MNKGLERAAGTFVVFLNAGDTFAGAAVLKRVSEHLSSNTIDFLYGDSLEAFAGNRLSYKAAQGHGRLNYGMFACHQAMFYRRSLIGDQRYDPMIVIETGTGAGCECSMHKDPAQELERRDAQATRVDSQIERTPGSLTVRIFPIAAQTMGRHFE